MKNLEPLLKEEEEKFGFQKLEEIKEPKNSKLNIIITIVLGVITVLLMWYSFYPIYVGAVNYNEYHGKKSDKIEETEISKTSLVASDVYSYIDVTNNNELANMFSIIYGKSEVKNESLSKEQKLLLLFSYLGLDCDNLEINVTLDKMKESARKIFNDDAFLNDLGIEYTINDFKVILIDNVYKITKDTCLINSDYTYKEITKVTTGDDYIFIYEKFGYFVLYAYSYDVYTDALKSRKLTSFPKEEKDEFKEMDMLSEYKWTFKKGSDNNYYFVSVIPMI